MTYLLGARVRAEKLNALDEGVVADAVTDNKTKLEKAAAKVMTAAGGKGVLLLPPGVYGASSLALGGPDKLRIDGRGATIRKIGTSVSNFITIKGTSVGVEFNDLTLDYNSLVTIHGVFLGAGGKAFRLRRATILDAARAANGVGMQSATDTIVEDCVFDGIGMAVMSSAHSPRTVKIRRNTVKNWKTRAFYFNGSDTTNTEDLEIVENDINTWNGTSSDTRQPIAITGDGVNNPHRRVTIDGNTVVGNGFSYTNTTTPGLADLISIHATRGFKVTRNYAMSGGDMGITVAQQCAIGVIEGNVAEGNDVSGLALGSGSTTWVRQVHVGGNTFAANGRNRQADRPANSRTGIWVVNAQGVSIGSNDCGDDQATVTQQYGVTVQGSTSVTVGAISSYGVAVARVLDDGGNVGLLNLHP